MPRRRRRGSTASRSSPSATKDGTELTGWYARASPGRPTLLYFHGNAGNISGRAERFKQVARFRLRPPRGELSRLSGKWRRARARRRFFSDGLEIFDWLAAKTPDIVVYGESLGTAVATYVAAERPAQALVLEAPFTAALDIAAATYPWVPTSLLMRDPFLSRENILRVDEPLLIVHGTDDRVVPVEMGRKLFALGARAEEACDHRRRDAQRSMGSRPLADRAGLSPDGRRDERAVDAADRSG